MARDASSRRAWVPSSRWSRRWKRCSGEDSISFDPGPHLRGHLLLFDRQDSQAYSTAAGTRLLIAFAFLEFAFEPRVITWLQLPRPPLGLVMFVRLGLVLWIVPRLAGINTSMLGFRRWREWSKTERSYLVQVLLIAGIVFTLVLAPQWEQTLARHGWTSVVLAGLLPYFAFGFYQEVAYRGSCRPNW